MGEGAPVVFIHGLFVGNLATWYFSAAPKLSQSHHVLLYDLRGHGKSPRTQSGYDLDTMTRDLESLVESFSTEPLTLVGHSYGALIALNYALSHPERVNALVLVEAPLPPSELQEMSAFLAASTDDMVAALPPELQGMLQSGGRRARRFLEGLHFLTAESTLLEDLRNTPDVNDEQLARLQCPVLCLYGEQSSCKEVGERLARVLPDARLELLPGGHFLPLEAADEVSTRIVEFVRG